MAHHVESMFSVLETPWHKLGRILDKPPTTAEAIVCAGLDWKVAKRPLFLGDGRAVEAYATVRDSDGSILGSHVGPGYTVLQNAEAFAWLDPFIASGQATIETAGSLRCGSVVWALAKLAGEPTVIVSRADDRIEKYLLLSNSHDGTQAVRVGFSPIRVVCANTLAMAHEGGASSLLRVKHTSSMVATLDAVRDCMNVANASFEATAKQYRALAVRDVSVSDLAKYVAIVFDAPEPKVTDLVAFARGAAKASRGENYARVRQETVERLFSYGKGNNLPGVRGTWWAAYNAVTEYLQYERPRSTPESRIDSLAFGSAATTSRKALATALRMAA